MADARKVMSPKFGFHVTDDVIALTRDNILLRIYPRSMKFQLDRLGSVDVEKELTDIKVKTKRSKQLYGVFGYIKLVKHPYLVLVEEASIVG